jgi:hypothetical protein
LQCSFFPFFGQKIGGALQEVSLLSLSAIAPYLRAAYFVLVIGMIVLGLLTLALQKCHQAFFIRIKASLLLNAVGTLLFIISSQPYAAAFLFVFLVIKVLLTRKVSWL